MKKVTGVLKAPKRLEFHSKNNLVQLPLSNIFSLITFRCILSSSESYVFRSFQFQAWETTIK